MVAACHTVTEPSLNRTLAKPWKVGEDEYCDQYFDSTHYRNSKGQFVVRLPFARRESLIGSRNIAVACLKKHIRLL